MKFFIDSANLKEIREANSLGILDGVTTNPSLMAKENIRGKQNILSHYKAICNIVTNNVSAEVIGQSYQEMLDEAYELVDIDPKIVIKVPITVEGLKVIKTLSDQNIRTNCTLIFTSGQALLAAKAGASYVSPFIGRLDDISSEGMLLIEQIVNIFKNYGIETEVLAASIRSTLHIIRCAEIGADVVTCPLGIIQNLLKHPLTDSGLEKFIADYKKGNP
ncbi:MAG: fructose-6-phosphate aldolase [Chitinophagaceae bacterium]|nr:fructose-6-phosphate aldolase [Chitinophagaceae bacterium]